MVALHPNTKKILNKLLPITLPTAIPEFFFKAAVTGVANSGSEVPPATMVNAAGDYVASFIVERFVTGKDWLCKHLEKKT